MIYTNLNKKNSVEKLHPEAGVTLLELIAALAIISVIIIGALALYTSAQTSQASTQMVQDTTSIRSAVKVLYQGQGTFGTVVLNDQLVAAKRVPTTIKMDTSTTPDTLTHGLNGTIVVTGAGATFTVALSNIPPEVCIPLLTTSQGWLTYAIDSAAAASFPVTPATAVTACTSSNVTVTLTGN